MTARFAGKVALVTGATRGIGAAIVRQLVAEGARVAFCGRTANAGAELEAALGGPDRVRYLVADLSKVDDCATVVDATVEQFGRLDILVNNAASVARGTLATTSPADFDAILALNLRAPFLLMQRALPTFQAQHAGEGLGGVVINIGSINAYIGGPHLMAYSASKGGLMTLSRNLAHALAQWRVRVHVLNVGWTLTEGEEVVQHQEGAPSDWATHAGTTRPAGRLLEPTEIAAAVAFFASDEAAIFSGAAIDLEQFPIGRPSE
ncbi:MAG: SDR family oxidoreductase [Herpetosiphonaceae bacterium]|nr:SDR family oxidoreductase [Herpetosiphonaceae bacterium]